MWRFLNSIPRAFRSHVHSPRPSAGLYVEEEQEQHEVFDRARCPITGRRNSHDVGDSQCSAQALNRLIIPKQPDIDETHCSLKEGHNFNDGRESGRERRHSCQYDFWSIFKGSHHMLEAISLGSAMLWGTESNRRRGKTQLLYRVFFATPGTDSTLKTIKEQQVSAHLAIKDAAGAAHDAAVNFSKTETLDSALEEFQTMCTQYEAKNESLLGLEAAEKGDFGKAVQHLKSSCMMGNKSSCFNLGLCYETGSGVMQNLDKAKHYYELAAKAGHSMALYNLGLLYMNCQTCDMDEGTAQAAGDCDCGCNKTEGISLMEKAAKLGLVQAQTYLGVHHVEENGDAGKAVPYFKAAADQNDSEAQYFLAVCYERGWGVEVNECRAAQLYSLAASAGHESALYNLAVFNEQGLGGLPEDSVVAVDLYQKAAELGSELATDRLQEMKNTQASKQQRQEKVRTFQELYQLYNEDRAMVSTQPHHKTSSLSPSASSPDLFEYLHKSISSLWRGPAAQMSWNSDCEFDPGGSVTSDKSHRSDVTFHLADSDSDFWNGSDDSLPKSEENNPCDQNENFHRSYTYPNFSMIACNI